MVSAMIVRLNTNAELANILQFGIEEEHYYMQQYIEGNLEAKHILIERNLRLISHIIKKYQLTEDQTEDLISIGTIGLIKAVTTYDPSKNSKLGTYAARCIENEILMFFRSKKKISKDTVAYFTYNFAEDIQGKVGTENGIFFKIEEIEIICFNTEYRYAYIFYDTKKEPLDGATEFVIDRS